MKQPIIRLRDDDPAFELDFPFELSQELQIDGNGNVGVVEDAIREEQVDSPREHYTITYFVKTPDGTILRFRLNELLALNASDFPLDSSLE
jgi:hypothetical protein